MKAKPKIKLNTIYGLSFLAFFFCFQFNPLHIVESDRFSNFARPAESLAIGRIIQSGTNGILSDGGLCGRCMPENDSVDQIDYQYEAYQNDLECRRFVPYKSQTGGHAMLYGLLDRVFPFSGTSKLFIFRALNAALLAALLSVIIGWVYLEFGMIPSAMIFLSILLTPWFTLLGRNIWYALWTNFLPVAIMLVLLRKESSTGKWMGWKAGLAGTLAILTNFIMNGYEWVSTTLIMAFMPIVYYYLKDRWQFRKLTIRLLQLSGGVILSIGVSFSVLAWQIASLTGRFKDGFDWLYFSFLKRTYGGTEEIMNTEYARQVESSLSHVIYIYLGGTAFYLPPFLEELIPPPLNKIYFAQIILLFLLVTIFLLIRTGGKHQKIRLNSNIRALIFTTWVSIIAPLSWFIIFKGHAFSHWHMNNITWFMPFCLFGFAMTGTAIEMIIPGHQKRFIKH